MKTSKIFLLSASLTSAIVGLSSGEPCVTPATSLELMTWRPTDEGRLERSVNEKALEELSKLKSKVAIVSMTGPHGVRKASVLDALALEFTEVRKTGEEQQTETSFQVKNNVDDLENNHALNMLIIPGCMKPLDDDGTTALVLIDSFGLSATSSVDAQDGQLLAVLNTISSVVLYHSSERIRRADVAPLRSAAVAAGLLGDLRGCGALPSGCNDDNGGGHIEEGDAEGGDGTQGSVGEARAISHPALRWLVRKPMVTDDGEQGGASAEEYLENVLNRPGGSGTDFEALSEFYGEMEGFFLPHLTPAADHSDEFTGAVTDAKRSIVEVCSANQDKNSLVEGASLAEDLRSLVEDLDLFDDNRWEAAVETKFKQALETPVENAKDEDQSSPAPSRRNFDQVMDILQVWEARWDVAETLSGGSRELTGDKRREKLDGAVYSFLGQGYLEAKDKAEEDFTKALEDLQIKWKAGPHEKAAFDELSEQASEELKRAEERVRMVCGEVLAGEAAKEMKWSTRVDTCTKAWEKDVYPESVEKPETEREIKPGTEKGKQKDSDETGGTNGEDSNKKEDHPKTEDIEPMEQDDKRDEDDRKKVFEAIDDARRKLYKLEDPWSKFDTVDSIADEILKPVLRMGLSSDLESEAKDLARDRAEKFDGWRWKTKCEKKIDEYESKVKAASSLLSLAPLRHSRVPRFPDEECLEHQGAQVEIVERSYNRSTWGRRWLVRLLMWFGLVTTVTAAAMIVTGRKLHSRPVEHAILASAVLHLVLLCLATSNGLILGSRLWWLGSAAVLCLAWTGADLGTARGRGIRRGVWSATGGRSRAGSGGVMPLFRAGSATSGATAGMGKGVVKMGERARYND